MLPVPGKFPVSTLLELRIRYVGYIVRRELPGASHGLVSPLVIPYSAVDVALIIIIDVSLAWIPCQFLVPHTRRTITPLQVIWKRPPVLSAQDVLL